MLINIDRYYIDVDRYYYIDKYRLVLSRDTTMLIVIIIISIIISVYNS